MNFGIYLSVTLFSGKFHKGQYVWQNWHDLRIFFHISPKYCVYYILPFSLLSYQFPQLRHIILGIRFFQVAEVRINIVTKFFFHSFVFVIYILGKFRTNMKLSFSPALIGPVLTEAPSA